MRRLPSPTALAAGALAWSAAEYALHRYIGHGPRRRPAARWYQRLTASGLLAEFNAEHLAHHADPTYFVATGRKAAGALVVGAALGLAGSLLAGPRRGWSFALGLGSAYAGYEFVHRFIHTRPPTGPYSRWVRRNHLRHHFRAPRLHHGVTSPLWDALLRTGSAELGRLRVPAKHAPRWMVDPATDRVRDEFSADYELAGASP
ncbi:MAG: Fatty acid hydroxylase-like protein [Myxococcaceae bacterium]|nr:Fatty acid hydroxylase-like protein [Myxococcaceae bacterium]